MKTTIKGKPQSATALIIKVLRKQKHISQKILAKRLKIPSPIIRLVEKGQKSIGKELAKKLAHYFKIDYRLLFKSQIES